MNHIIIITGESGSGKSFLAREVLSNYNNVEIIKRYTTRKSRKDEENVIDIKGNMDLKYVQSLNYLYLNPLNNNLYGYSKNDIDLSLKKRKIPCITLTGEDMYKSLLNDYKDKIIVFKVEPYFTEYTMKETFIKQKRDKSEFEERKVVLKNPLTNWTKNYDNVYYISNPYILRKGSIKFSKDKIYKQIDKIALKANINLGIKKDELNN